MIAILDSGIGGLEIFHKIKKLLPQTSIFYYADEKYFPYGNKTNEQIAQAINEAYELFASKNAQCIVLACNTASVISNALYPDKKYKNIPIIDTIASLEEYAQIPDITLISTQVTYNNLLTNPKFAHTKLIGLPDLENLIETHIEQDLEKIEEYMKKTITIKPTKILYACTHYPLVHHLFQRLFQAKEYYNPSDKIAQRVKALNIQSKKHSIEFSSEKIKTNYKKITSLLEKEST